MYFENDEYEQEENEPKLPKPLSKGILAETPPPDPDERISLPQASINGKKAYLEAKKIYEAIRHDWRLEHISSMYLDTIEDYEEAMEYSQQHREAQKCRVLRDCIVFFYRDNHFYMRTPSFARAEELVPMLKVWLRPQYRAYQKVYVLSAKGAKDIIKSYKKLAEKSSVRSEMEKEVASCAFQTFTRADFSSPLQIKKAFRRIFPSELFESMDEAIVKINSPSSKKVFLRNNKTDQT